MKLVLSKTLWGVDLQDEILWDSIFARIKADGFAAVESIGLTWRSNPDLFKSLLKKNDLKLIVQIHTNGGYISDTGGYVYCANCVLSDHVTSFRTQLEDACRMGAVLVNTHSGHDSWSIETAVEYFKQVLLVEEEVLSSPEQDWSHVRVVHETHRQRLMYSPYQAREILSHPDLARLKINADLSHWVCVCEHVFDPSDPRDAWWPEVLNLVARHCYFVHARIGHAEGPQVYDPRNQELWRGETSSHLDWWAHIWEVQKARGMIESYVEPEHGASCCAMNFRNMKLELFSPFAYHSLSLVILHHFLYFCIGPAPYQVYNSVVPSSSSSPSLATTTESEQGEMLWDINNFVRDRVVDRFATVR